MGIILERKTKVAHKPRSVIVLKRFCWGEGVVGVWGWEWTGHVNNKKYPLRMTRKVYDTMLSGS